MANDQAMLSRLLFCHQVCSRQPGSGTSPPVLGLTPYATDEAVSRAPVNRRRNQKTPWQFCVGHCGLGQPWKPPGS
jgi:hypothetical protein